MHTSEGASLIFQSCLLSTVTVWPSHWNYVNWSAFLQWFQVRTIFTTNDGMSMAYHVFSWFFGNGEPTPLVLHCKHTLTQWILKKPTLPASHKSPHTQASYLSHSSTRQKLTAFVLFPPISTMTWTRILGTSKLRLTPKKFTTLPVWARVFLPKNTTLWELVDRKRNLKSNAPQKDWEEDCWAKWCTANKYILWDK